jgi:hypothetical protein
VVKGNLVIFNCLLLPNHFVSRTKSLQIRIRKSGCAAQQDLFGLIPNELLSSPAGIGAIASTASTSNVSVDVHGQGIIY